MLKRTFSRTAVLRLLIVLLAFCVMRMLWTDRTLSPGNQADFYVYDTAATLVRQGGGNHLYDQADNGQDPQLKYIAPDTAFAKTARSIGLHEIRMYVYPPILADLLLPLAGISAYHAGDIWMGCNFAMLILTGFLLTRILGAGWKSWTCAAVYLGLVGLFSVTDALRQGQITLFLLLLWVISLYCYQRGWQLASGCALALATAIKLTPLIAVAPFLVWRNWKWLRGYFASLFGFFGAMAVLNSPAVLVDYFLRVTPAMSRGVPHRQNRSVSSCLQMLYASLHGNTLISLEKMQYPPFPAWIGLLGKLIPFTVLVLAVLWVIQKGRVVSTGAQLETLAAFAILSVVVSPVSWFHAFVVGYPMLVFLWLAALEGRLSRSGVVVLTLCSLDLAAFLLNNIVQRIPRDTVAAGVACLAPVLVVLAVFLALKTAAVPSRTNVNA